MIKSSINRPLSIVAIAAIAAIAAVAAIALERVTGSCRNPVHLQFPEGPVRRGCAMEAMAMASYLGYA